ncbi:CD82 antigen-like [Sinocyclocheilus grahami]|uniref:CD82 antigen-like n=1 Tax=Sinocyclocheilus grahami TaxID=75366 RepID=UPI0007AD1EC9|nr:PREDICTED: CD82 antigen-like [Sinocyclocheilus grahami]
MEKGCIAATKYFLFLFNLLFFIFGAVIMGFGLWVILDNQSFITVLQESSTTLKVGAYILIGIGSLSMLMGFLGCIGAIYEVRCLLGLYFTCLLLILIAQVTAAVMIYFQRDLTFTFFPLVRVWLVLFVSSDVIFGQLCLFRIISNLCISFFFLSVLCVQGCISSVEDWVLRNSGVILGVCVGIAVIELLGMILSMCLCKSVQQEDYTKVPKY